MHQSVEEKRDLEELSAYKEAFMKWRREISEAIFSSPAEHAYLLMLNELESALLQDNRGKIRKIESLIEATLEESVACDLANSKTDDPGGSFSRKPIEVAAREGLLSCVQHYLNEGGVNVNDVDNANQTLLHHATIKNNLKLLIYLIQRGANVNAKDNHGSTPLHLSAIFGTKDTIEILLKNGAIFDEVDNDRRTALDLASDQEIIKYLSFTNRLFESVKQNQVDNVENALKEGAFVDAENSKGAPLHYAAWKGYTEITDILLNSEANPSILGNNGLTPLHFAAKFSHLKIVELLLAHGAIYNAVSNTGKTPRDMAENDKITSLFDLVDTFFLEIDHDRGIKWEFLESQDDVTIKAVLNARNKGGELCKILRENDAYREVIETWDLERRLSVGRILENHQIHEKAFQLYKSALEMTGEETGESNRLKVRIRIADYMQRQGRYQETLDLYEDILQRQIKLLGPDNLETLQTHCCIAMAIQNLGRGAEALQLFKTVLPKLTDELGPDDEYVLQAKNRMGVIMTALGYQLEALRLFREVYESAVKSFGPYDPITLETLLFTAENLSQQEKFDEALEILRELLKTKIVNVSGMLDIKFHLDVNINIGKILVRQQKHEEALKLFQDISVQQRKLLPPNHPDILVVELQIATAQLQQGNWVKHFERISKFSERKGNFGPSHSAILRVLDGANTATSDIKQYVGSEDIYLPFQEELYRAAVEGDAQSAEECSKIGIDVNRLKDAQGRTSLHQAVNHGHTEIVKILLKNGARVHEATNKGNTPLHTAALKNDSIIVELLLRQVSGAELNALVDAQTTTGGNTALHVAAEKGFLHIVKCLLKFGAMYNLKNKDKKMPVDLSSEKQVTDFLNIVHDSFESVENSDVGCIANLREREFEDFLAIAKARNNNGRTLLQVAMLNKRGGFVDYILNKLKSSN